MTYIKRIRIRPVRSNTGFLMWQLSYYINRRGSWDLEQSEFFYLTSHAFTRIKKVLSQRDAKVICS